MKKIVFIFLSVLFFNFYCFGEIRYSNEDKLLSSSNVDEIITPLNSYKTKSSQELAKKFEKELNQIITKLKQKNCCEKLSFLKGNGIGFYLVVGPKALLYDEYLSSGYSSIFLKGELPFQKDIKDRYLGVNIVTTNWENFIDESSVKSLGSCLKSFGKDILEVLMQENIILAEHDVIGVAISISWWNTINENGNNNINYGYVEIYLNKQVIRDYLDRRITFLGLLEKSRIDEYGPDAGILNNQKEIVSEIKKMQLFPSNE